MSRGTVFAAGAAVLAATLDSGCTTSKDPMLGHRAIEATVVERRYDPPGTGGASYRGSGNYVLVFEGREGEATSRYTFQVTQSQYQRFQEGANVRIVVVVGNLRDIRRVD